MGLVRILYWRGEIGVLIFRNKVEGWNVKRG